MIAQGLPVATGGWFVASPDRHDAEITHITEPHVDRFIRCNIWRVAGRDCDVVIDTGLGVESLIGAFPDLFRDRRTIAVATHYHYDHVGGLHEFADRWIHEEEADRLPDPAAVGGRLRTTGMSVDALTRLEEAGYAMPFDGELVTAVPRPGFDPDDYAVVPCAATRLLDEGDLVDLGNRAFEVLHLPGHSPGSIGLWDAEAGVLFSGDAVYDGPLLDFGDDADVERYIATMKRLRELPVRVVHGGHEPSFGRERLIELCDTYLRSRGA